MADDDIYKSAARYERVKAEFSTLHIPRDGRKYHCKNKKNIKYFYKICDILESRDVSYIRRLRLIQTLRIITFSTSKDLKDCERDDINKIMAFAHTRYKTVHSKKDFIKHLKYFWRNLFPVLDEKGLPDETLTPHCVRHLSGRIEKAKQRAKKDKLTWDEYEKILNYFGEDPRMQAYISLALESLGRPQEILYTKIGDVQLFDNYAKISLSDHTKEGVGILQCIDTYPYLLKWLEVHPQKDDDDSFLFINTRDQCKGSQLQPKWVNSLLKQACKKLGIKKPITCYSLKRNGVTFRRLRGDSDVQIQHAARWTSTKQLKTYDQSDQQDAFRIELIKRGYIKDDKAKFEKIQRPKQCIFCDHVNGHQQTTCIKCKRPLDRTKIRELAQQQEKNFEELREDIQKQLMQQISNQFSDTRTKQVNDFLGHPEIQKLFTMVTDLQKVVRHMKS